jgi:hypothetical protein
MEGDTAPYSRVTSGDAAGRYCGGGVVRKAAGGRPKWDSGTAELVPKCERGTSAGSANCGARTVDDCDDANASGAIGVWLSARPPL